MGWKLCCEVLGSRGIEKDTGYKVEDLVDAKIGRKWERSWAVKFQDLVDGKIGKKWVEVRL